MLLLDHETCFHKWDTVVPFAGTSTASFMMHSFSGETHRNLRLSWRPEWGGGEKDIAIAIVHYVVFFGT